MSDTQNFDELIRQKVHQREFTADEAKWKKALALIESEERRKKNWKYFFVFFSSFLLVAGISFWYFTDSYQIQGAKKQTDNRVAEKKNEMALNKPIENNIAAKNENSSVSQKVNSEKQIINGNTEKKSIDNLLNENAFKENHTLKNNAVAENKIVPPSKVFAETPVRSNVNKHKLISKESRAGDTSPVKTNSSVTEYTEPVISHNETSIIVSAQIKKKKDDLLKKISESEIHAESLNNSVIVTSKSSTEAAKEVSEKDSAASNSTKQYEIAVSPEQTVIVQSGEIKSNPITSSVKIDSFKPLPENSVQKIREMKSAGSVHPLTISLLAGGNYVNEFSLNPIAGIMLSKEINASVEIGTGFCYTSLKPVADAVKVFSNLSTTYDFGYYNYVEEIKTTRIHYFVLPVFAKYNFNEKNSLLAGVNIHYMFTVSNMITIYTESYGTKQNETSVKTYGYSSGFNNLDFGAMAGYKRKIKNKFGAAVLFNFGFTDIKKNDYYKEDKFNRNLSVQFVLTYDIFHK